MHLGLQVGAHPDLHAAQAPPMPGGCCYCCRCCMALTSTRDYMGSKHPASRKSTNTSWRDGGPPRKEQVVAHAGLQEGNCTSAQRSRSARGLRHLHASTPHVPPKCSGQLPWPSAVGSCPPPWQPRVMWACRAAGTGAPLILPTRPPSHDPQVATAASRGVPWEAA